MKKLNLLLMIGLMFVVCSGLVSAISWYVPDGSSYASNSMDFDYDGAFIPPAHDFVGDNEGTGNIFELADNLWFEFMKILGFS